MGKKLKVGDIVMVNDKIIKSIHRSVDGIHITYGYQDFVGKYFRIKAIRNTTKHRKGYVIGTITYDVSYRRDTEFILPYRFLDKVDDIRPCLTVKSSGSEIEEEVKL